MENNTATQEMDGATRHVLAIEMLRQARLDLQVTEIGTEEIETAHLREDREGQPVGSGWSEEQWRSHWEEVKIMRDERLHMRREVDALETLVKVMEGAGIW